MKGVNEKLKTKYLKFIKIMKNLEKFISNENIKKNQCQKEN